MRFLLRNLHTLVWSGLVWSDLVWSGLVWSGLVWSGLVWSGFIRKFRWLEAPLFVFIKPFLSQSNPCHANKSYLFQIRNIILNNVRQHNYFITQDNYIGYMFRLLFSHLQAYFVN